MFTEFEWRTIELEFTEFDWRTIELEANGFNCQVRKVLVVRVHTEGPLGAYRLSMISNDLRVERRVNRNTGVPYHGYIAFMLMVTHILCVTKRERATPPRTCTRVTQGQEQEGGARSYRNTNQPEECCTPRRPRGLLGFEGERIVENDEIRNE